MIARLTEGGAARLEASPEEMKLLASAMADYAAAHQYHSMARTQEADMRRGLAAEFPRGRRANIRAAGELEAEAANHRRRAEAAIDLLRVLTNPQAESRHASQIGK